MGLYRMNLLAPPTMASTLKAIDAIAAKREMHTFSIVLQAIEPEQVANDLPQEWKRAGAC